MKLSNTLYKIARKTGKAASTIKDIECILSGNPVKIVNRLYNKTLYKCSNGVAKKFMKR